MVIIIEKEMHSKQNRNEQDTKNIKLCGSISITRWDDDLYFEKWHL